MADHDPIDVLVGELRTDVPEMTDRAFEAGRTRVQAIGPVVVPLTKRRLVASAAAVVALVAGTLVASAVPFGDNPSAAAESLDAAAREAGTSDYPVGPGQYRYVETRRWSAMTYEKNGFSLLYENTAKTWIPADQTTDWLQRREVSGRYHWLNGNDEDFRRAGLGEPGGPNLGPTESQAPCGDFDLGPGEAPCTGQGQYPTPDFFAELPRDAGQLYERLRTEAGANWPDPNYSVLRYAADLLRTGLVPPDLRAALYRALAKVPGLEITDQSADLDGLRGTAYGISTDGERYDVVINTDTGQYIGERVLTEKPREGIPAGTVTHYTSVSTAVVNEMGEEPTG